MSREFSEMVKGTHPDEIKFRDYVLAELRCARMRAQLLVKEIEVIGIALRGGVIHPEMAVEMLAEANALDFLLPAEPAWVRPEDTATTPVNGQGMSV
jgi:hypothetical protein